jgi:hypothetical protein
MKKPPSPAHIDEVKRLVAERLERRAEYSPIERAMGLALILAEELFHDGAGEHDAVAVMKAAWRRCVQLHQDGGGCKGIA